MALERLTVGRLKKILKAYNVPDSAIICCGSDEELNRQMVCYDVSVDRVNRKEATCHNGKWYEYTSGEDVMGIDLEKDKDKIFVMFLPLY